MKFLKILPVVGMLFLFSMSSVFAYTDVGKTHKYYQAIGFISDEGIVSGYSDGSYGPSNYINRAEILKILVEATLNEDLRNYMEGYASATCFEDVPAYEWYTMYICYAKSQGMIAGYSDGTFQPGNEINLVETLKLLMEFFEYTYPSSDPWYQGIVDEASLRKFIPIDFISFDQKVNRGQMADAITRILKYRSGDINTYLGDKKNYNVTYNTLLNNTNVELVCESSGCAPDNESPSGVTNLVAEPMDGAVKLTWDAATDNVTVDGYIIYYGETSVDSWDDQYDASVDVGDTLEYTLGGLINDTKYYFNAIAYDALGNESEYWTVERTATPSAGLICPDIARVCDDGSTAVKIEGTCDFYCPEDDDLITKICGKDDPGSGFYRCSDAKKEVYGCDTVSDVTYWNYDFLQCNMTGVDSDEVLVYSGGMLQNGYNLIAEQEDSLMVVISDYASLFNFWGDITTKSSAKGYMMAGTGFLTADNEDDLYDLYGDDLTLDYPEDFINYSSVYESNGKYYFTLYNKPDFGCAPFPVTEYLYEVDGQGNFVVKDSVVIGEVDDDMCVD